MPSKAWVKDGVRRSDAGGQSEITAPNRSRDTRAQGEGADPAYTADQGASAMRCPSGRRPIDLVHLSAQTCGDRQLEREVLAMFKAQLDGVCGRLEAADLETRGMLAHALKGAAQNIGAFPLAQSADLLDAAPDDDERLADLLAIIVVTTAMIDRLVA